MSPRTALAWAGLSILLAAGLEATPARAQTAQGKTHVGGKPSRLVSLIATLGAGEVAPATVVTTSGNLEEPLVLPPGTVLVVTDMYAEGVGTTGPRFVSACTGDVCSDVRLRLAFDSSVRRSDSMTLTSGALFREAPSVSCAPASAGTCTVRLYGYLAKDK